MKKPDIDSNTVNDKTEPATRIDRESTPVDVPHIDHSHLARDATAPASIQPEQRATEFGGQTGPEPTRYGDWEKKGRCTDF